MDLLSVLAAELGKNGELGPDALAMEFPDLSPLFESAAWRLLSEAKAVVWNDGLSDAQCRQLLIKLFQRGS